MIEELSAAIDAYQQKWATLISERADRQFFKDLKPLAVGWKTKDLAEFDRRFAELRERCDHIHIGLINNRWIATMHLKEDVLPMGITVVKLMQRREGSNDAPGLDNIDFRIASNEFDAQEILAKEPSLKWEEESNGFASWISLWFNDCEAKLRTESVLEVCIAELRALEEEISK